jgi:hypothetical protein
MEQENISSRTRNKVRRNVVNIRGIFQVQQRYQTHVSTDKLVYKLNDTVYVRGILLSFDKQQPISGSLLKNSEFYLGTTFQILGPVDKNSFLFLERRFNCE